MPSPNPNPNPSYEALFHASSLNLLIPEASSFASSNEHKPGSGEGYTLRPEDGVIDGSREGEVSAWWQGVESSRTRDMAYFDEKLCYLVSMHLSDDSLRDVPGTPAADAKEPTSEMLRFLGRLQLTMTASFIPPLPSLQADRRSLPPSTSTSSLAPPAQGAQLQLSPTPRTASSSDMPPVTPMPFPAMSKGEEQYANVEGVVVWEGPVEDVPGPWENKGVDGGHRSGNGSGSGRKVFRSERGWEVVWRGEVPVAYVRTQIQNPLLALTASVTLRETQGKTHRRAAPSLDTMSIRSGTTVRTDGTDYEVFEDDDESAGMEEIDLLGGLAGGDESMPATRLAPSLRQDLSIPSVPLASPLPLSAQTPASMPSITSVASSSSAPGLSRERGILPSLQAPPVSTTLRKSYRRVLSLAPGLRVRMRTLFLPQLLSAHTHARSQSSRPDGQFSSHAGEDEDEGEKRIVLCVEVENSVEPSLLNGFEVEDVLVEVGGKGGKASTRLVCQPGTASFPLRLGSTEQYNLLYTVTIASPTEKDGSNGGIEEAVAKSLGRGDEQRPVSITVVGRPFCRRSSDLGKRSNGNSMSGVGDDDSVQQLAYPTKPFQSRWNCTLDLSSFYASSPISTSHLTKNRNSKVLSQPPPNAIAGDKRYSLAHLLAVENERAQAAYHGTQPRIGAGPGQGQGQGPMLPSQAINQPPGSRVTSLVRPPPPNKNEHGEHGLLLSVKLLPQPQQPGPSSTPSPDLHAEDGGQVRPLDQFSLEVFVHNRTDRVRRFRLTVPPREGAEGRIRDIWKRRRRDGSDWAGGADEGALKASLAQHLATCPALIPLENDIRCGPLLPGSSLSARIRFLALREGVHRLERLRVVGVGAGDEVDYTLAPVLDVVVGPARD